MNQYIEIIGLIAATLTTVSFGPQVYKVWKEKSTVGISWSMYTMIFVGMILWIIYGVWLESRPIIIANGITICMVILIIFFKFKYKT